MDGQDNPPLYDDIIVSDNVNEDSYGYDAVTGTSSTPSSSSRNSVNTQNEQQNENPNNSSDSKRNSSNSQNDKSNGHKIHSYTDIHWDSKQTRSMPDLSQSMSELEINKLRNNSSSGGIDDKRRKLSDQPSLQKSRSNSGSASTPKPGTALGKTRSAPKSSGSQGNFKALKAIPSTLINDIIGKDDKETSTPVTSGNAKRTTVYSFGADGLELKTSRERDRSIYVKVIEAKDLPSKKQREKLRKKNSSLMRKVSSSFMDVSNPNLMVVEKISADPYAIVTVEEQTSRTRTIAQKLNPFWAEEFTMDVNSPKAAVVKIQVCDANKYEADEIIGKLYIPILSLNDQEEHEQWYPLFPAAVKYFLTEEEVKGGVKLIQQNWESNPDISKSVIQPNLGANAGNIQDQLFQLGCLRVKVKYTEEIILPLSKYQPLLKLIMEEPYELITLLGLVTPDRETVAGILIRIFHAHNRAIDLLNFLTAFEIQSTSNPDIIFRGNSVVTKALDVYMKFVGLPYLHSTLRPLIKKLFLSKSSCEIDPSRLEKPEDLKKNQKKLLSWVTKIFQAINSSLDRCPYEFRIVFHQLQSKVRECYTSEQVTVTQYTGVSGFIFLRFFCPAILGPKLFGITDEHPSIPTARTLILIAKTLQNLANLVEFTGSAKEEYMHEMNQFVVENMENMKLFLDTLCDPTLSVNKEFCTHIPQIFLEKELASIYRHFKKNAAEMRNQATTPAQIAIMEQTQQVLKVLEQDELQEKKAQHIAQQ
eukprot:CAMPEP_0168558086 /NCGR_PEP_ID=MMETSP0413-20121227/9777_1 /TAXON_ID=136452 /ORGANISM="Filamoeba nolandi, Strain NC-AS-23-1" /LENGTH=757 /DNA_ID=CAMNT_0008589173 /DNA_START=81 /DNA_END=2354 /DNA_ORIENTATION=+